MTRISATILTFNEEKNIEACLKSVKGIVDEIIVVDSGSTDSTVDICRRYGCLISQREFQGYGAMRQYATSLTTNNYVLSVDADEVISPQLAESLQRLKTSGFTHRVYKFNRLNFFCGTPVKHCGWYPDPQIRLFDKRYANWNLRDISEGVIFRDSVNPAFVEGDILHYRCDTLDEYRDTQRRHVAIRSRVLAAQHPSIGPLKPYVAALSSFLGCYIGRGGMWDGVAGRLISRECYFNTRDAYRQARELQRGHDIKSDHTTS